MQRISTIPTFCQGKEINYFGNNVKLTGSYYVLHSERFPVSLRHLLSTPPDPKFRVVLGTVEVNRYIQLTPDVIYQLFGPTEPFLNIITGIGELVELALYCAEIRSYKALAESGVDTLRAILTMNQMSKFRDPSSWPSLASHITSSKKMSHKNVYLGGNGISYDWVQELSELLETSVTFVSKTLGLPGNSLLGKQPLLASVHIVVHDPEAQYNTAEIAKSACDKSEHTIFGFIPDGFDNEQIDQLIRLGELVNQNGGEWLSIPSPENISVAIAGQLKK